MKLVVPAPKFPQEIFPLEVWNMIFHCLESPSDVETCYNTCKVWQELLKSKRTSFLMPQVFPSIYNYLTVEITQFHDYDEAEDVVLPYLDTLKMRKVSRFWKEAVDTYYQNHSSLSGAQFLGNENEEFGPRTRTRTPFRDLLRNYKFRADSISKLQSFNLNNYASGSNPLLCRYVSYVDHIGRYDLQNTGGRRPLEDKNTKQRARTLFIQLLKSFGSQISTCVLGFPSRTGRAELYKLVRSFLALMPNLKSLKISVSGKYAKLEEGCLKTELEALLKNKPLPNSKKLSEMILWSVPFPLSVGILTQNHQLRMLSIKKPIPNYFAHVQQIQMGQLEKLMLKVRKSEPIDWQPFQELTWPVKALTLRIRGEKLERIFQAVSAFRPTLEQLNLSHDNVKENSQTLQNLRLQLPNLKKFELRLQFPLDSINFLEGCASLEEMEVEVYRRIRSTSNPNDRNRDSILNAVELQTCRDIVHNSEAWKVLPALQVIKIKPMCVERHFPIGNKYGIAEIGMQHVIHPHKESGCEACGKS